jgi:hypothetical protein
MSLIIFGEKSGAAEGTRTPDPIITNDVLYQLSYSGVSAPWPKLFYGAVSRRVARADGARTLISAVTVARKLRHRRIV